MKMTEAPTKKIKKSLNKIEENSKFVRNQQIP